MANINPTGACSTITRATNSGWYRRSGRYGCTISSKPPVKTQSNGLAVWSIPSAFLGGMTLYNWRRAIMGITARQWKNSTNISQANFATAYTYTTITGAARTESGYRLFKHVADIAWETTNFLRLHFGGSVLTDIAFDMSASPPEPAPPAITAASWDGKDTLSITLSNYTHADVRDVAFYATAPGRNVLDGRDLFQITAAIYNPSTSQIFTPVGPNPSAILKPWPKGAEVLLGIRVWTQGVQVSLPSPIAAELITIS